MPQVSLLSPQKFFENSHKNLISATEYAYKQLVDTIQPYSSLEEFTGSLYTPFVYLQECVANLARITQGSIKLIEALFSQPWYSIPYVLAGIGMEAAALILNACMAVVACVSLIPKTIANFVSLSFESTGATLRP